MMMLFLSRLDIMTDWLFPKFGIFREHNLFLFSRVRELLVFNLCILANILDHFFSSLFCHLGGLCSLFLVLIILDLRGL